MYGIDVESGILRDRTWRWLRTRIAGLFSADTRTWRHFRPDDEEQQQPHG